MNPRLLAVSALPWVLIGCALTAKSEPWMTRYFSPDYGGRAQSAAADPPPSDRPAARLQLRLGQVSADAHLAKKIAFRTSYNELNYYEDRRWTEKPDVYLRRALARSLFEEHGIVRVVSGNAPTLEVELLAFEEIAGKQPRTRMQALVILHDQRLGRLERTITVEHPIAATRKEERALAVVVAMAESLHAGVTRIAQLVLDELAATPGAIACPCGESKPSLAAPRAESRASLRE